MIIVYGFNLFGVIDEMPDGTHVATRFFHIMRIPLIPLSTFWILSQEGSSFRGHRLPLSFKSILVAYLRVLLLALGIGALIPGILSITRGTNFVLGESLGIYTQNQMAWTIGFILGGITISALCIVAHLLSKRYLRVSQQRYEEILSIVRANVEQTT